MSGGFACVPMYTDMMVRPSRAVDNVVKCTRGKHGAWREARRYFTRARKGTLQWPSTCLVGRLDGGVSCRLHHVFHLFSIKPPVLLHVIQVLGPL